MATDRMIETDANGTASRITIMRMADRSTGSSTLVLLLLALVLAAVTFFAFVQMGDAEVARDHAVAEAAGTASAAGKQGDNRQAD